MIKKKNKASTKNTISKVLVDRKEPVRHKEFGKGVILMILCTFFTSTGQIFLKSGMSKFQFDIIALILNYNLIIGAIFYGLGLLLLTGALKRLDLSLAYPFISLSFIWVALLSYFLLGEKLLFLEGVGILIILAGVIFIGMGEKK